MTPKQQLIEGLENIQLVCATAIGYGETLDPSLLVTECDRLKQLVEEINEEG